MNRLNEIQGSLLVFIVALSLAACDTTEAPAPTAAALELDVKAEARNARPCTHVRWEGPFDLGAPVVIPLPDGPLAGYGALPTPVELGPFVGLLSSVVTSQEGTPFKADHLTLVHYFDDGAGNTFWTNDKAVCAPAGPDPSTCRLNDAMTVVGGTGDFADASGKLHNHGTLTITDPTFQTSPFGFLEARIKGRVCGGGL